MEKEWDKEPFKSGKTWKQFEKDSRLRY